MKEKLLIETIGTIEKKESLVTVGFKDLVLESLHPYPGYHGETVPDSEKPKSLFFITRSKYSEEKIIRVTQKIKKDRKLEFDGSPGLVTLYNMLNPCIRVRDVDSFNEVENILAAYKEEGIEFMSNRKIEPYSGNIKIKKYFLLDPITNCTFRDAEDSAMHYFTIPVQLRWNVFEKMTVEIKQNLENKNFDAALGTFFRREGLIDVIRLYDEKCTPERIDEIRPKYAQAIKKLIK